MARLRIINIDKHLRTTVNDLGVGARQYMKLKGQKKVKTMESEVIDEKVYSRYNPKVYERRGREKGGLKDVRNMKDEIKMNEEVNKVIIGHLYITNKTKRVPLSKKEYAYANDYEDFLYMIKDEGMVYDFTKGGSQTYEEWGNGGKPLYLTKALDKKVQNSKELRNELKDAALQYARKKKDKRKS